MNMLLRQGGFGASCAKSPKWCTPVSKEDKVAQLAPVSKVGAGRGNKGGESEAARQLGLDRDDVRRAIKVASITPEAQQTAHEVGNRWATKSKQLLASASRWVQLVGIWWTSLIPARQNCFTENSVTRCLYFVAQ